MSPNHLLHAACALPLLSLGLAAQEPQIPASHHSFPAPIQGELLVGELGCAACHDHSGDWKSGPRLDGIKDRLSANYLREYIARPHAKKPGTTMPDLLAGYSEEEKDEIAGAIVDYLFEGKSEPLPLQAVEPAAVERGQALYTEIGCVACHNADDADLPNSYPLIGVDEKYSVKTLTAFLEDPLKVRPDGRMPDLNLTHWEAKDLASYLLREQKDPASAPQSNSSPARIAEGKKHFEGLGCVQCHSPENALEDFAPALASISLAADCSKAHYELSPEQKETIAAFKPQTHPLPPAQAIQLKMAQMNCYACHSRDEIGGPSEQRDPFFTTTNLNLGDQARIPPPLDGVGAKLKPKALRKILRGDGGVRPYMKTRMPNFGKDNIEDLIAWLGEVDHVEPMEIDRNEDPDAIRKTGWELVGEKNLACNACHTFLGEKSTTLDALDLSVMHGRLKEDWFHRYLRNPQKFHPTTIMPGFWPEGRSVRPGVLDGNADKQIDAIWQYLSKGREARRPIGVRPEPIPYGPADDEAVLLRRQYNGIGKRGIGVGYPSGINIAFDAGKMTLRTVWQGDFAEMSAVWRGQGSGFVKEAGDRLVQLPAGPSLAKLPSMESAWPIVPLEENAPNFQFKGYSVDQKQRPTFRYLFEGIAVEDKLLDSADGPSLTRTLTFAEEIPEGVYFRLAQGSDLQAHEDLPNAWLLAEGLVISSSVPGTLVKAGEEEELRLALAGQTKLTLVYQYLD
ncbi:MAG: c-type cytochrome [Verrucomicrobiota bacterium JB023]|nr:c-type cytochrome [Verrucomicrobiota bacterium JB023]